MQNESDKVRALIRRTINRLHREEYVPFGWDWPTLCTVKPEVARELLSFRRELRALKSAGL